MCKQNIRFGSFALAHVYYITFASCIEYGAMCLGCIGLSDIRVRPG